MTPPTEAPYRIKARSVSFYRPTIPESQMSGLKATKKDLEYLIGNTKRYMSSPQSDFNEKARLEQFLEGLYDQLEDIDRQIAEGQV